MGSVLIRMLDLLHYPSHLITRYPWLCDIRVIENSGPNDQI